MQPSSYDIWSGNSPASPRQIRDLLLQLDHGESSSFSMLVGAVMSLCLYVEEQDKAMARTANVASCLANGIQPD